MAELPRIPRPTSVSDYEGPSRTLGRFQADGGPETRIASACRGVNCSFLITYDKIESDEVGPWFEFWETVGIDRKTGISLESFSIPENHPFWCFIDAKRRIERHWLWSESIDDSLWIVKSPSTIKLPICGVHDFSIRVEEVPG